MTRRGIQVALGVLWLLDGALQLQPYMFGRGFADQIIAPAGEGQPGFVSAGVTWAADLVGAHPVAWDSAFAAIQLAIGIGLLLGRTARAALLLSIGWALGVWYFGEGLGGLGSGHADLLTGAPGAVLLYAVLALAAWPVTVAPDDASGPGDDAAERAARPAAWLPVAWAVLWIGGAVLRMLPGQNTVGSLAGEVSGSADGAPGWLGHLDRTAASGVHSTGAVAPLALAVLYVLIGVGGLAAGRAVRTTAACAGLVVALVFWCLGQSLGELTTGQSTDPNSAPLVILLALALISVPPRRSRRPSQTYNAVTVT